MVLIDLDKVKCTNTEKSKMWSDDSNQQFDITNNANNPSSHTPPLTYKEGNNRPSSVNQISLVGNKC